MEYLETEYGSIILCTWTTLGYWFACFERKIFFSFKVDIL